VATDLETGQTASYTVKDDVSGGELTVQVNWAGPSGIEEKLAPMPTGGKDSAVCKCTVPGVPDQHLENDRLVVNDGKVANALVYLADVKSGKPWPEDRGKARIDQEGCVYVPIVAVSRVGEEVEFTSSDSGIQHTVMIVPYRKSDDQAVNNLNFPATAGGKVMTQKLKAGLYELKCQAGHNWMNAYVLASNNPYAGVTGAQGRVTFTDVPAGNYTLKVLHPDWNFNQQPSGAGAPQYFFNAMIEHTGKVAITEGETTAIELALQSDDKGRQPALKLAEGN
jgi:plastocyanin